MPCQGNSDTIPVSYCTEGDVEISQADIAAVSAAFGGPVGTAIADAVDSSNTSEEAKARRRKIKALIELILGFGG